MKIGLFGGSFDPVHLGHLMLAQTAREEAGLDRLFFIPAGQSPFKPDSKPASAAERLRLLRLALAGQTNCEVDDQEIQRGGTSFTIDTVRAYAEKFPGAELLYLIGADQIGLLHLWREATELARMVQFLVVPRPGQKPPEFAMPFRGQVLRGVPLGISSSEIRARLKGGLSFAHLTPPTVAEALANNHLYL
jgi:nicotinate-nucleotide adenylyltransferase